MLPWVSGEERADREDFMDLKIIVFAMVVGFIYYLTNFDWRLAPLARRAELPQPLVEDQRGGDANVQARNGAKHGYPDDGVAFA